MRGPVYVCNWLSLELVVVKAIANVSQKVEQRPPGNIEANMCIDLESLLFASFHVITLNQVS